MRGELAFSFVILWTQTVPLVKTSPVTIDGTVGHGDHPNLISWNPSNADYFRYPIPGTDLTIEGRIDGPRAKKIPGPLFNSATDAAIEKAHTQFIQSSTSSIEHEWATRLQGVQIEAEAYDTHPPDPFLWSMVLDVLEATKNQIYRLEYRESTIILIHRRVVGDRVDETEVGHITWSLVMAVVEDKSSIETA